MHVRRSALVASIIIAVAGCRFREPRVDPSIGRTLPDILVPQEVEGQTYDHALVLGDWGTDRPGQRVVAAAMAERARQRPIDFVLTTGDNFYVSGVGSVEDPLWEEVFEDVYADRALQVPFYASLGNHDHKGNVGAQVEYSKVSERWVMPAQYYDFTRTLADGTVAHFLAIDSTPIHSEWAGFEEQLRWLEDRLARSTARWKIVFGHHPLYTNSGRENDVTMIEHLEPIFDRWDVDLYFAGHDHILELLRPVKGVQYVVSGGGGGPDGAGRVTWRDETTVYAATGGGFVALRIGRDELVLEFVRTDARTQFVHVLRKAAPSQGPAPAVEAEAVAPGR